MLKKRLITKLIGRGEEHGGKEKRRGGRREDEWRERRRGREGKEMREERQGMVERRVETL